MKIYGYEKTNDDSGILNMAEITICTTPETLREIAKFIQNAANELETDGEDFGHLHLRDNWSGWDKNGADIIICQNEA